MSKGVTLVELLLTMAIILLLFGIGIMFMGGLEKDSELDSAIADIKTAITKSQIQCLNNIPSGIYFESNKYTLYYGISYVSTDPKNEITDLPQSIIISNINIPSYLLTFNKITGYVTNYTSTQTITVATATGKQKVLSINRLGTVEIN